MKTTNKERIVNMMIVKFRKKEDAHRLMKRIKTMREEIEEIEGMLQECMEDEHINYRNDNYDRDDDDYGSYGRRGMNTTRYRRMG